jgi:23S rRNA (adenine-N6)-dimethyltransferase
VAAHARGRRADGQHFLRSQRIADELVVAACVRPDEVVLEIGAGSGRLTEPLRLVARRVIAVELDPVLAATLERRFARDDRVAVVHGDIMRVSLPSSPFRAVGNVPFGITTAILRRLLDDRHLHRADLIVQHGLAHKRSSTRPATMLSLSWLPWWEISLDRHLPAACFEPPPSVDAALLVVRRRQAPLLDVASRDNYRTLLRSAFNHADRPVRHAVPLGSLEWKRLARGRGLPVDARPRQLDVWDWIALHDAARRAATRR